MENSCKHKELKLDSRIAKKTLKNGLTYYWHNNKSLKDIINISLVIKVGSLMENYNQRGIAHFTEHLCIFNNDLNCLYRTDDKGNLRVNSFKGYTNFNETVYSIKCSIDELSEALLIFSNIMVGNNITIESMDKVRKDLINEVNKETCKIDYKLRKNILPIITGDKEIIDKLPLGQLEHIRRMKYDSIMKFHDKWYKPENSAIFVVGNTKNYEVEKLIEKYFLAIKRGGIYTNLISLPKNFKTEEILINTFENINGYEAQFYYQKKTLEYEFESELEEKSLEYSVLRMIKNYIHNAFDNKYGENIYYEFDFTDHRLMSEFNFNVMSFKTDEQFYGRLKFIFELIKELVSTGFSEIELKKYKVEFLKELDDKYEKKEFTNDQVTIEECINNYLYNEPVTPLNYEYNICRSVIKDIKLEDFNFQIMNVLGNANLKLVINAQDIIGVDKCIINRFLDSILNKIHK